MKRILLLLFVILSGNSYSQNNKPNVCLEITNVNNNKGTIKVGIFKSDATFKSRIADKKLVIEKTKLKNKSLQFNFYLEPGIWGISVLDDENNNGDMDYNFFGIPLEGYGFSNYSHKGLTSPDFSSFSFTLKTGETKKIVVKMSYF